MLRIRVAILAGSVFSLVPLGLPAEEMSSPVTPPEVVPAPASPQEEMSEAGAEGVMTPAAEEGFALPFRVSGFVDTYYA